MESQTVLVTDRHRDVTTYDNGGRSGTFETVFELQTPTDVVYELRPERDLPGRDGLKLRLFLKDSSNNDLPADTTVRWIGQSPVEENEYEIGTRRDLQHFQSVNQYDSDEVFTFDLEKAFVAKEDRYIKMQIDSSTAVDWSNSQIELEVIRKTQSR